MMSLSTLRNDERAIAAPSALAGPMPARFASPAATIGGVPSQERERRPVVHLVDTDQSAKRALAGMFESRGLETRSYRDLGEFAAAGEREGPGCLVVEVRFPSIGELPAQPRHLGLPMVITASRPDIAMAVQAMKAGAIDFLERPLREQEIVRAVSAALEADRERRLVQAERTALRERFERLTKREREVMALVTAGRLNKQVAGDLGLSEITVKVHRGSVMRKMGARTLVDLVRMADAINKAQGWPGSNGLRAQAAA
jgi:FixJ family two-component response regulator